MGKGSLGSHLYVSSYQEKQKRVIPSYLTSAIASAISQQRISRYRMGGMFQLNLIGAISNPKLINKQNYTPERHSGMFFINSYFLVSKKSLWLKLIGGNSYKDCRMLAW